MEAHSWLLTEAGFNGENVEPPRRIFQVASAKKLPSHAGQIAAFLMIDGVFRPQLA
jgi:hypothetical protein